MLTNQVDEPLADIDLGHGKIMIIIKYSEPILEPD